MRRVNHLRILVLVCFVILTMGIAKSQVVINEFMASNTGAVVDPDYDESSDWIELYNAGNVPVHVGGYYITDDFDEKEKWEIPIGVEIPAKGFVIIWADGVDQGIHTNFKLSSSGEEIGFYSPVGDLLDSISYELQEPNISFGRKNDHGEEWKFFTESTPGESNNEASTFDGVVKNKPWFTPLGGIFTNSVSVSIKNVFGGKVYYTVDGSEPTIDSEEYSGEIQINEHTIVRARIIKDGEVPGEVITHTYFIDDEAGIGTLPVISIATAPENFWDEEIGIYVQDFKPSWEIPINIELFENDGSDRAAFNQRAGAKINGLYSWQLPQKMVGIYFRKTYGSGKLEYPLFLDRERKEYDTFALRAAGNDWSETLFRDGLAQSLTSEHMDVDFQGFRQCVVYVNGAYMGIHNIRSKVDQDFVLQNHNLGDQKIDMIEYEEVVEEGNINNYEIFEDLYHKDLSDQTNYNNVSEVMDIDNFTDFIIAEIYSGNSSISHNVMAWKPQFGGKWKWILMDLDRGFKGITDNKIDFYESSNVIPFGDLLENDEYQKYFGKRLANHLFTTYHPDRVKEEIDKIGDNIDAEIYKHIERWEGHEPLPGNYSGYLPIASYDKWIEEVDELKEFAEQRPAVLLEDLEDYGFNSSIPITVSTYPLIGGHVLFNDLEVTNSFNVGAYPGGEEVTVTAEASNGYTFKGWGAEEIISIIDKESSWKYNDQGVALDSDWTNSNYDDSEWSNGFAELGYGDGDEVTEISYGGNSGDKQPTTYFRKNFTVLSLAEIKSLKVDLKCDDGSVVYLNGTEVARTNLPDGEITYDTHALTAIGGSAEDEFRTFLISADLLQNGANTVAVEVHQFSPTSSDISFDLSMSVVVVGSANVISEEANYTFTHLTERNLIAIFETENDCVLPEVIEGEYHLSIDCSPYNVPNDVVVIDSSKLIIDPGVELHMGDNVSITVNGAIVANGTVDEPILFTNSPFSQTGQWGIIKLVNADTSFFSHVVIEAASKGGHPIREIAAISAFNSVLRMDNLTIDNVYGNPILARLSDVVLTNSFLHSEITGDLINVKYGKAFIENCEFVGNNMPDTDAIDYDDVTDGIIKDCIIRDFHGFNSDAIDIGEKATNITIENVVIYNITDKGISVGQQSSANILNSIFVNCDMGAGLKDSCHVIIDHCTYYGNNTAIANYEKNAGDAGGNVFVTNSILSNSYDETYLNDENSSITISYSASDDDDLPEGNNNVFVNPEFNNPNLFDFSLVASSSCIDAGTEGNMGASLEVVEPYNQLFISAIAYNSEEGIDDLEFLAITNSGSNDKEVSRFEITDGITFQFPDESIIRAGQTVYLTNDAGADFWLNKTSNLYEWESGRLSDEGEAIQFETTTGIIVDRVRYNDKEPWPIVSTGQGIILKGDHLDNHFGENWESVNLYAMVGVADGLSLSASIYPNPTTGVIHLKGFEIGEQIDIFSVSGIKFLSQINSINQIDISHLQNGIYVLKSKSKIVRIILTR